MSKLGTVGIQGIDIPVFEIGDSDENVSESIRVSTGNSVGFIPTTTPDKAAYSTIRLGGKTTPIALHDRPTTGVDYGQKELVDDFEDADKIPASDVWGPWQSRADEIGKVDFRNTTRVANGNHALKLDTVRNGFIEANTTRDELFLPKKFECTIYADIGNLGHRQDAISILLIDDSRRAGVVGVEISGNGNVGMFFDPEPTGVVTRTGWYDVTIQVQDNSLEMWDVIVNGDKIAERRTQEIDHIQLQADAENAGGGWIAYFDDIAVYY